VGAPLPAGVRVRALVEDNVSILRGLKEKYELHHGVRITDSALVAAATLSNAIITDRFHARQGDPIWSMRRPRG